MDKVLRDRICHLYYRGCITRDMGQLHDELQRIVFERMRPGPTLPELAWYGTVVVMAWDLSFDHARLERSPIAFYTEFREMLKTYVEAA